MQLPKNGRICRTCSRWLALTCVAIICAGCHSAPKPDPMEGVAKGQVVGGYVVYPTKTEDAKVKQQRAVAHRQEQEIDKQQTEIENLKRQQYYDQRLKEYIQTTKGVSSSGAATPPATDQGSK